MSLIRGLSSRFIKKKDETTASSSSGGAAPAPGSNSAGVRIADGESSGPSSISPLELLFQQQQQQQQQPQPTQPPPPQSASPVKARPAPPTTAPPRANTLRAISSSGSKAAPFVQPLVFAAPSSSTVLPLVAPPIDRRNTGVAPPPPRTAAPVKSSFRSASTGVEFDDDDDDSDDSDVHRDHDDDDDDDDDDDVVDQLDASNASVLSRRRSNSDGPKPSVPFVDSDSDDDDSLFDDDSGEFAEEPLPPVPSEPSPSSSAPPPPSVANPLVDELLNGSFLTAPAPLSARSGSRDRTLTRTKAEKQLAGASASMRMPTMPSLHGDGGARGGVSAGANIGAAAALFASATAGRAVEVRAPPSGGTLAPGLLKSASEPHTGRAKQMQQQTGWLHKKGKRRWFLLRGNVLYWFSKEVDPMADIGKGVNNYLELAGCTVTATDQPRFSVLITPPAAKVKAKPYTLTAQDEAQRMRWLRSLGSAAADVRDNDVRVVTSGYMVKKGKRRFFVLEDDQLKWYVSSKLGKGELKGCLQLATCRLSGVPVTHAIILDSTSAAKSYELSTSSPDEYKHWMQALDSSIQHAQTTWRERHGSRALRAGGLTTAVAADGDGDGAPAPRSSAYWTFAIEQTIQVTTPDYSTFTSYMVDVTAPNGTERTVLKRYRQFDDLDAALRQNVADKSNLPSLPTKKLVGNMNPQFVRNRCLGLQRYLNQVAQLPGINEMPEFVYFVTEHTADDGWLDSRPLTSTDTTMRWAWLDDHRVAAPAPPLVDAASITDGALRVDFGCSEPPPWHARKPATRPAPTAADAPLSPRSQTLRAGAMSSDVAAALVANAAAAAAAAAAATATATAANSSNSSSSTAVDDDDTVPRDVNLLIEETVDRDVLYYRSYFAGRPHDNYVSPVDTELGPVVLTVDGEGVAITATSRVYKVLVRTKRGDRRYSLTSAKARGERLKEIRVKCGLGDLPLQRVRDGAIEKRLIDFERKLQVTRYKFGVLRVGAGQTGEDEIYANTGMPAPFERFLDVLGERIALLGFDGYTGGLNTRDGSTGVSSVYTKFQNFEVMFHVAPLLPFFEDDKQQVERKRHLGNDVVLVIFLDSDAAAFDPRILTSHFNSAFVVVRPVANAADQYDVAVVYKSDVRPVRPFWSSSRLSGTRDEMHTLLLTKLVNLERAAMSSGEFIGLDLRTRNLMLSDICTTFDSK